MSVRTFATTAALVVGVAITAATPSFAAGRHHVSNNARQYESLVQRDAAQVRQVQQPRTFSVWGSNFTMD